MVTFDDFKKLDLRVAKIIEAERVDGSDKLLKLQINLGSNEEANSEGSFSTSSVRNEISSGASSKNNPASPRNKRQIIAGIGKKYDPEALIGREIIIVASLEPKTIMGLESQGMLLAVDCDGGPVLLQPDKEVAPGTKIC